MLYKDEKKNPRTGIYTPYLQGGFLGELITQLYQLCALKNQSLSIIKTDGFGDFDTDLHIDHIDQCIILRNALHPQLVKTLISKGKIVVSIGHDYFPLNVPVISCDNDRGISLALNFLFAKGHRRIAFVGDISNYDTRKRYESYCMQLEQLGTEPDETLTFVCEDEYFSGGYRAVEAFLNQHCDATGVICGSGLSGVAFCYYLQQRAPEHRKLLDIVSFDALSVIPILTPSLNVIDQNLHLMAYHALQAITQLAKGERIQRNIVTEPKLISDETAYRDSAEAYLATSVEVNELLNANYMKAVLGNLYEWPKVIADSGLSKIAMMAPLFSRHMQHCALGKVRLSKSGQQRIFLARWFNASGKDTCTAAESSPSPLSSYPEINDAYDLQIHLPLKTEQQLSAVLSVFANHQLNERPSSISGMFAYLDETISQYSLMQANNADGEKTALDDGAACGIIAWDTRLNSTTWDDDALSLLGFTSELDRNIYRHMEISDRIHSDDEDKVSEALRSFDTQDIDIEIQLKHKDRHYLNVRFRSLSRDAETLAIRISPCMEQW